MISLELHPGEAPLECRGMSLLERGVMSGRRTHILPLKSQHLINHLLGTLICISHVAIFEVFPLTYSHLFTR